MFHLNLEAVEHSLDVSHHRNRFLTIAKEYTNQTVGEVRSLHQNIVERNAIEFG
jgi:hypothetical protein